jgi:hypothetical protein
MTRPRKEKRASRSTNVCTNHTPLVEFVANVDFNFRFPNASAAAEQQGRAGDQCLTNLHPFIDQIINHHPDRFHVIGKTSKIKCLPSAQWSSYDFTKKRVLFLLPSHALGDNVPILTFIHALDEKFGLNNVGVFCTGPTHDIYLTSELVTGYPIWITKKELKRWSVVIDLGHLQSWKDIDIWPIDLEADLLAAFDLAPSSRYTGEARTLPARELRIGILPLASSPLRTLPAAATQALVKALTAQGHVTLCLNRNQHQGVLYRDALGQINPAVDIVDAFESIGDLLTAIQQLDYAVFADSGPAHISKLFGTPGVAIYTSAPGDILQGRFRNLTRWTVPFAGPHCRAPCGLAKVRATVNGTVGCMGSLQTTLDALPNLPRGRQPETVKRLLVNAPVPCIARLSDIAGELAAFVAHDLDNRIAHSGHPHRQ